VVSRTFSLPAPAVNFTAEEVKRKPNKSENNVVVVFGSIMLTQKHKMEIFKVKQIHTLVFMYE
jgi:hypothetical protein